jgi:hypothetical protein
MVWFTSQFNTFLDAWGVELPQTDFINLPVSLFDLLYGWRQINHRQPFN